MANIYLYKFNNYFNRMLKRIRHNGDHITPTDINQSGGQLLQTFEGINFTWLDGVNNELILAYDAQVETTPDYCLIEELDGSTSVWFVLNNTRTRKGQFRYSIYRDLLNTHYDEIVKLPIFVEKALLSRYSDLIFNKENMTYNQIKKNEFKIIDGSGFCWLIGYIAPNHPQVAHDFSIVNDTLATVSMNHDEWGFDITNPLKVLNDDFIINVTTRNNLNPLVSLYQSFWLNSNGNIDRFENEDRHISWVNGLWVNDIEASWFNLNNIKGYLREAAGVSSTANASLEEMKNFNGNNIQFADGVYKVILHRGNTDEIKKRNAVIDNPNDISYITHMTNIFENKGYTITNVSNYSAFGYEISTTNYYVTFEEVPVLSGAYKYTLPTTARSCIDAEYKMFGIPLKSIRERSYVKKGNNPEFEIDKNVAMAWAMDMAKQLDANLYDLQILPFSFISSKFISTNVNTGYCQIVDTGYGTEGIDYIFLKENNTAAANKAICYFAKNATFERTKLYLDVEGLLIWESINVHATNDIDFKIENETEFYRLCSPNYASAVDMKATENDGIKNLRAYCTYKPYQPYVCIQPEYNRLYGNNFRDSRGLILSGDFSLPISKDAWVGYQIQNKYYQDIFDRGIQNMSVNNSIAMQEATFGAIAGSIQGAASGAMTGALSGGGAIGAVVGGVVGGVASGVGGVMDIENLKKRQAEVLDYSKDLFGYQLGNIKALPNTLVKVGSLTANSKLWPFIEYYDCTDDEKEALRNKIKYNGMSVGIIDKLSNYLYRAGYIKGKIIRFEYEGENGFPVALDIDYHEATVIAEELNKGVYVK